MTDRERIEAAYAHMDEVDAARLRGEETDAERELLDARDGASTQADEDDPAEAEKAGRDIETEASGKERAKRPRRPKPSDAARAWLDRQALEGRRRSLTVSTPAEALALYEEVRGRGAPVGTGMPEDVGERAAMEGSPIEVQVWAFVRATRGYDFWRRGEMSRALRDLVGPIADPLLDAERRSFLSAAEFEARIAAWPLPRTFFAPLPSLCGAEVQELARGRREIEEAVSREARGDEEGRLRPGMAKAE